MQAHGVTNSRVQRGLSLTEKINIQPVVLCGGSGARLWPLSRFGFPTDFLRLTWADSLFQLSTKRLMGLATEAIQLADPLIVTSEEPRFLALEQLRKVSIRLRAALLEPQVRNTAPALTLAALAAAESGDDPAMPLWLLSLVGLDNLCMMSPNP